MAQAPLTWITAFSTVPSWLERGVILCLCLLLWGCQGSVLARSESVSQLRDHPLSRAEHSTTTAEIYLSNLQGQIGAATSQVERFPTSSQARSTLSRLDYTWGLYLGSLDRIQRALDQSNRCLDLDPGSLDCLLLRARQRQTLHRFPEARSDLRQAAALGADPTRVTALEQELDWLSGEYDAAIHKIQTAAADRPSFWTLARLGILDHDLGHGALADQAFRAAEDRLRDPSPIPLAWLYVQWGSHQLSRGEIDRAIRFYRAAVDRVPTYPLALEHLAEALHLQHHSRQAVDWYRLALRQSPNPEIWGALAGVYQDLGWKRQAEQARQSARQGFIDLLERYPEAMAWHGAGFWLHGGQDPSKALALLETNLDLRPNGLSWWGLAEAQRVNGHLEAAQRSLSQALATPLRSASLYWTAAQIYRDLDHPQLSQQMLHQAQALNPLITDPGFDAILW